MLSVRVQRDITSYKPKIVGQLTLRSLVCSSAAIGVSVLVGAYFYFVLGLGYEFAMYAIIILSIPIWAAGFWSPYGMKLEKFIPLAFKHYFGNNIILYISSGYLSNRWFLSNAKKESLISENRTGRRISKTYEMLRKRPDFEAYSPLEEYYKKCGENSEGINNERSRH